jgi:hypothetical protein
MAEKDEMADSVEQLKAEFETWIAGLVEEL